MRSAIGALSTSFLLKKRPGTAPDQDNGWVIPSARPAVSATTGLIGTTPHVPELIAPNTTTRTNFSTQQQTEPPIPDGQCQVMDRCSAPIKQGLTNTNKKLDDLQNSLNGINTSGIVAILGKLNAMDAWLITKFAALWWHRIIDRALATFTFILALHNAMMLSANLGQSLGQAVDSVVGRQLAKNGLFSEVF